MYGVVTRNEEELEWPEFDLGFYEVKDVTGRQTEPVKTGINMISCFGDNAAAEADPSLVPVSESGEPATRECPYFDWAYICPTREGYKDGLLALIDDCTADNDDLRLDDVGFPRNEYCYCDECQSRFETSEYEEWEDWRANVITEFVEEATDRIPGRTFFTLYPDPYPGHLFRRAGLDITALEPFVDEFVVPLYDLGYHTTYWLEVIASGFVDLLDRPFSVELYAVDLDIDRLIHATEVVETYGKDVFFGYDASTAQAAIRRKRADENSGETYP
mgnify:FL=1